VYTEVVELLDNLCFYSFSEGMTDSQRNVLGVGIVVIGFFITLLVAESTSMVGAEGILGLMRYTPGTWVVGATVVVAIEYYIYRDTRDSG
jgi:hypothetical protein